MSLGLDIELPTEFESVQLWADISANDLNGVMIDGLLKGDIVELQSISGVASFTDSGFDLIQGGIGLVNGIIQDGVTVKTNGQAEQTVEAIDQLQTSLINYFGTKIEDGKRRDGFGMDPSSGEYATNEGGIIVCMPSAKGPIYASDQNHLNSGCHDKGRLPCYFPKDVSALNSWFPCRLPEGMMQQTVIEDGVVNILAFDSNYKDNAGVYMVKINIFRGGDESTRAQLDKLCEFSS